MKTVLQQMSLLTMQKSANSPLGLVDGCLRESGRLRVGDCYSNGDGEAAGQKRERRNGCI
ncbi:hypothetical protein BDW72DRAFT_96104 [Aspergillus terricola var. indicus]